MFTAFNKFGWYLKKIYFMIIRPTVGHLPVTGLEIGKYLNICFNVIFIMYVIHLFTARNALNSVLCILLYKLNLVANRLCMNMYRSGSILFTQFVRREGQRLWKFVCRKIVFFPSHFYTHTYICAGQTSRFWGHNISRLINKSFTHLCTSLLLLHI